MKYLTSNGVYKETPSATDKVLTIDGIYQEFATLGIDEKIITNDGVLVDFSEPSELSFGASPEEGNDTVMSTFSVNTPVSLIMDWGDGTVENIDVTGSLLEVVINTTADLIGSGNIDVTDGVLKVAKSVIEAVGEVNESYVSDFLIAIYDGALEEDAIQVSLKSTTIQKDGTYYYFDLKNNSSVTIPISSDTTVDLYFNGYTGSDASTAELYLFHQYTAFEDYGITVTGDLSKITSLSIRDWTQMRPSTEQPTSGLFKAISLANITNIGIYSSIIDALLVANCPLLGVLAVSKWRYDITTPMEFANIHNNISLSVLELSKISLEELDLSKLTALVTFEGEYSSWGDINILGAPISYLSLFSNNLTTTLVDKLLLQLDSSGIQAGGAYLDQQTPPAVPSAKGLTAKDSLVAKGWQVYVDA